VILTVHAMNKLDSYLGIHASALKLRSQRTELLASNLANADTPNYKARDVDFKQALAQAAGATNGVGNVRMAATRAGHLSAPNELAGSGVQLKYRTPLAPSLDGNTVDVQMEQAAFAENSVRYQATLSFLSAKFRGLLTAITGQ
jgi:flagellar basal-body rod protein FlgB